MGFAKEDTHKLQETDLITLKIFLVSFFKNFLVGFIVTVNLTFW